MPLQEDYERIRVEFDQLRSAAKAAREAQKEYYDLGRRKANSLGKAKAAERMLDRLISRFDAADGPTLFDRGDG